MENDAKHLASNREFAICGEKLNYATFTKRKYQVYSLL